MSTPRTKRQFAGASADPSQRQITSFFSSKSSGDVFSAPSGASTEPLQGPVLPAHVQANLLSVGMRVRKSVPEGYKTAGSSAFKIWTDNRTPAMVAAAKAPRPSTRNVSRELLPFCGINKVGGLDTQPDFEYDDDDVPALDDVPELTMSQESADGNVGPSRKRIFDGDFEDDGLLDRSATPAEWSNDRVMAVPRSRARKNGGVGEIGQENMAVNGNDFQDAGFLVFGAEKGMDLTG